MKSLIIATISFLTFNSASYAQENWELYSSHEAFEISIRKDDCKNSSKGIDKEYLFLKIENTSEKTIQLVYKIEKWYDGICSNCDDSAENPSYTIELDKGESTSGSCENYRERNLAIFSKMNGSVKARSLTSFKIIPLKINDTNIK